MATLFSRRTQVTLISLAWALISPLSGLAQDSDHWPPSIRGEDGHAFEAIGKAISAEPGYPFHGTTAERADYVFKRLPELQRKYRLQPGSGSKFSDAVIGLGRTQDGDDPEEMANMKGHVWRWGNCAEFSQAFQMMLQGAGVPSEIMYADKVGGTGYSGKHTGTDTAVFIEERQPDGRVVRRAYDPFRAVYHTRYPLQAGGKPYDFDTTLELFGDLPMSNNDVIDRDNKQRDWLQKNNMPEQWVVWQNVMGKPFIKSGITQTSLPPLQTEKNRNLVNLWTLAGRWREKKNGFEITIVQEGGGMYSARITKRSGKMKVTGTPENAILFLKGTMKDRFTLTSKNMWEYCDPKDCESLPSFRNGDVNLRAQVNSRKELIGLNGTLRAPQYFSTSCRWALNKPWAVQNVEFVPIKD